MNCKNCGTRVSDNTKICPNCGAMLDENEGYVLLTDNDTEYEDFYSSDKKGKKKKGSGVRWFLSILLTLAIIGAGAYYYFENIYDKPVEAPAVTFEGGTGVINGDEQIVYVTIKDNTNIEYIHGVTLYDEGRHTNDGALRITDKYQYTKSINDSFRAIFFDLKDMELQDNNTYTFEMQFSFSGDDTVYDYSKTVTFSKDVSEDVSDIIFDHSTEETTTAVETETITEATTKAEETTTAAETGNVGFVYDSYWFTEPDKDGDELTIYAYKFSKDNTFTLTKYYKDGNNDWEVTSSSGSIEVTDYSVTVKGKNTFEYIIDADSKSLESESGVKLTSRKYNSVKNAEDFFGI